VGEAGAESWGVRGPSRLSIAATAPRLVAGRQVVERQIRRGEWLAGRLEASGLAQVNIEAMASRDRDGLSKALASRRNGCPIK
jgi:hypothetical protein